MALQPRWRRGKEEKEEESEVERASGKEVEDVEE
jgi:hypothetical protein